MEEMISDNLTLVVLTPNTSPTALIMSEYIFEHLHPRKIRSSLVEEFFRPVSFSVKDNVLVNVEFPESNFYYHEQNGKGIVFFVSSAQPELEKNRDELYGFAWQVAEDAEKMGVKDVYFMMDYPVLVMPKKELKVKYMTNMKDVPRVFTSCSNLSQTTVKAKIVMTGFGGALFAMFTEKNIRASILMGELPSYIKSIKFPYPKTAKMLLEVLSKLIDIEFNLSSLDMLIASYDLKVSDLLSKVVAAMPDKTKNRLAGDLNVQVMDLDSLFNGEEYQDGEPKRNSRLTMTGLRKSLREIEEFFKNKRQNHESETGTSDIG